MLELLLLVIAISSPIFWVYGIICFLRNIFGGSNRSSATDNKKLITEFVGDLRAIKAKKKTLNGVLKSYSALIGLSEENQVGEEKTQLVAPISNFEIEGQVSPNVATTEMSSWWEHWYEENNINLLLYIGAFLIVSSAAIFVGFNWESLSGSFKAIILVLLTLAFFSSGFYLYFATPKLKNAGSTFLAIGSLLIPFNGLAWYNFVLSEQGVSFGFVWLLTSLVAVAAYFVLAVSLRNRFYTYIAGLGGLSLVEAMVNVSSLNSQFYILGGILSAFALLAGSKLISQARKEDFERIYSQPLAISSHIVMPIFLIWGFLAAYNTNQLFTPEVVLSSFTASIYYFLAYLTGKNISFFALGELLILLTVVILSKTAGISGAPVFYLILAFTFSFQIGAVLLKNYHKELETFYSVMISIYGSVLSLAIALIDPLVSSGQRVFLTLLVSALSVSATFINRQFYYLYFAIGGVDLASYIWVSDNFNSPDPMKYLGLFYLGFGVTLYFFGYARKERVSLSPVLLSSAAVNFILALIITLPYPTFALVTSIVVGAIAFLAAFQFEAPDLNYLGTTFAVISTYHYLKLNGTSLDYYPLAFGLLSYLIYLASLSPLPTSLRQTLKNSGLGISILVPLVFGLTSLGAYNHPNLELFALISAYGSAALLAFAALNTMDGQLGYAASIVALLTVLWQYKYLHITETQVYMITTAAYFLGLGYLKRIQKQADLQQLFNYIGLGFLLLPLAVQALPETGFLYAVLLGAEGAGLIFVGFSLNYPLFTFAGAGAIAVATLSRIVSFISSLPSWLTVGLGGLLFLGVGIYLLSKRNPPET